MKRLLPLLLAFLSACSTVQPPPEPVQVVIVGTTDVHGWFNGRVETPPGGGEGVLRGGLPVLASYIEALRETHGGRVLVVDSGDMFQGTLESNLFEGEPVVRGYNAIGYAAAAVGNHEFDYGPVGPNVIARQPNEDPLGVVKRNAALATFPFLSANMVEKATGKTPSWARRWAMIRTGGVRIALVGLSTPDTPNVTMTINVASLLFTDPVAATIEAAREARAAGADAVVVVAHLGGRCTDLSDPAVAASCQEETEAVHLLRAIPPGTVDALFAGHTHSRMGHYINGVAVLQGEAYSREFSTLDLWIDPAAGRVVRTAIRPHTMICPYVYEGTTTCDPAQAPAGAALVQREFSGDTIRPESEVAGIVEPFLRRVAAHRDQKVGVTAAARFRRAHGEESPLGNLIADALRAATGADIAFMNSGGIRDELPAGALTYGDVFAVSPFDNYPAMVIMTGEEVIELLQATSTGLRGILQVSGLRYTVDETKDSGKDPVERQRVVAVTHADGTAVVPDRLYTVVMPDFIAAGGDGAQRVMAGIPAERIQVYYDRPIRDVLVTALQKFEQPLQPRLYGRITVIEAPGS